MYTSLLTLPARQNILIQTMPPMDWVVKVCDLGLSKRSEDIAGATTMRGTPGFMPPEFLGFSGNPRTADAFMADMWCLGETVFQAITGRPTFESIADLARYQTGAVAFPDGALRQVGATEAAISFVQLLMMPRPWERLTAPMALDHPWMSTVRGPAAHIPRLTSSQTSTSTWVPDLPRLAGDQLTQASGQWTTTTPFEQQSSRGRRRLSTDQSPQSILDRRMRRTSRSPSPLGHARTFSVGTNTALPPSVPFPQVGAYIVRDARPLVVNGSVSAYSASPGNGPGHPSIVPSRGRGGPYQPVYDSRLGPYGSSLANSRYQVPVFRPMPYASYDYYLSTMTPQRIQAPYNMPPYISPVGATPSVILPTSDRARNPQIPPIGIPSPGTLALPSSPFYQSGQNERYGVDHPQLQPPAARSPTLPNSATFVKPPKHRAITIKSLDGSVFKPPPRATVPNRAEASDVKSDPLTVSAAVKQPSPGEAASASVVAPPPSGLNAKQGRDTGTNYSDSTEAAVPKDFGTSAAASQRGKYSKEVQVKWSELKKFAESFKLSTPMPTDLTHIITPGSNKRGSETKFDGKPKHGGVGTNRKSVSQTEIATKSGNSGGVQGPLYLASPPPQRRTTLASPAVRQLNEVEAKFRQGWREGGEQQDHDENEWEVVTSRRKRGSKQQLRGKGATADVTHHLAKG